MFVFVDRRVSFATSTSSIETNYRGTQTANVHKKKDTAQQTEFSEEETKPKLQTQKMPLIDIRGSMTLQKLKQIEIPPEDIQVEQRNNGNIYYEEVRVNDNAGPNELHENKSSQIDVSTIVADGQQKILVPTELRKKLSEVCPSFADVKNDERDKVYESYQLYSSSDYQPDPLEKLPVKVSSVEKEVYKNFIDPKGLPSDDSIMLYENGRESISRSTVVNRERTPSYVIDRVIEKIVDYESDEEVNEEITSIRTNHKFVFAVK